MSAELTELLEDLKRRMEGALESLRRDFSGLRSGRASPNLLEPVRVEAYGSVVPLSQVGSVAVPEARMLTVSVWDQSLVGPVEKAIRNSGLGLNPATEGQTIRVPLPQLTEERRNELAKAAARYTEGARIAVRGVRRDGMDKAKGFEKKNEISQDDLKSWTDSIQKLTDGYIETVDKLLADKERDIKQV
ncbi:ribosome recycling factor [Oecophyllibacter saccharovorans]|uniref:Ribosome-recycling factor n=1 Tax=Oecophyllibacter saccharovorans TaxID=2558360 RepID=A0A506UQ18_9PROT|nr:ribosome recycling factor [Oecophyllibacter saccharovorans]QDH15662.1 ribosome recycling factor [Oecophyllibacter saccharovorans]TPW35437.1 ribosome recycling factor [Oecophyllibacter saccharovorans]